MNKYSKKSENLKAFEYEKGIILPQKKDVDYPMWGLGGVCDSKNEFAQVSFYDGGWATHGGKYSWQQEDYIDEDVVYVGMFYLHWGHFLIDLTGRFWYLQQLCKTRNNFKVAYLGDEEPKGNNLEFLKLLGVKEEQLIHIKKPTRFRKVIVPQQSFKSCEWYTDEFVKMFDSLYETVLQKGYDFSKVKDLHKVYFTRRSFSKAVSSEFGEEYFEKLFVYNGYNAVAPETLTLEEQIYLWNNTDEIVCINGSIPLNVMFSSNKNLKLTILNKTSILHENPYILLQMKGIKAQFVDIYKEPFKKYPKSLGEGPYLLDNTQEFKQYCKNNGIKQYLSDKESKQYFRKENRQYVLAIINLKGRTKKVLRRMIPKKILQARNK